MSENTQGRLVNSIYLFLLCILPGSLVYTRTVDAIHTYKPEQPDKRVAK